MNDDDVGVGKGDAAIDGADGGVVPFADLAEVDAGEDVGGEAEVRASLRKMVDGDDGSDDGGELEELYGHLRHVGVGERDVRGCEGDLVVVELLDACLGVDGGVGDLNVRVMFAEGLDPGLIERGWEGCAGGFEGEDVRRGATWGWCAVV